MKHKLSSVLISVIILITLLCSCTTQKKNNFVLDETKDSIENSSYSAFINKVDTYFSKCGFQGSVLVAKDKEIILAKGYGIENKDKNTTNTMNTTFEIGSVTKQFTAVGILQLQEQGKLSVNDTLDKYFPDFKYAKDITIKNLLTMRSGLYDYINDPYRYFPAGIAEQFVYGDENEIDTDRDFVLKHLYTSGIYFTPGERYDYCNTNYYILGKIIEQKTGMAYEDYIKKYIFEPCEMTKSNTDFKGTTAIGYDSANKSWSITKNTGMGCGDINSSVIDLYKWNLALLHNKVINADSFKEMTTACAGYQYGVIADRISVMHGGSTNVFNSHNEFFLQDNFMIIVLINKPIELSNSTTVAKNIYDLYVEK